MGIGACFLGIHRLDIRSDPVGPFLALMLPACLLWYLAGWALHRTPRERRPAVWLLLLGGLGLRLAAWSAPYVLETDVHRYLWDGFVLSRGYNPYQFSPEEVRRAADPEVSGRFSPRDRILLQTLWLETRGHRVAGYLDQVNAPHIPTCYPPATELAFALVATVAPGSARAWKLFVVGVDFLLCLAILGLLRQLGRPEWWVVAYAWCPLVLKEYANTGHFDPLATLSTVLGVWVLLRGRRALAGSFLGLGIACKLYPLVLLPLLARRLGLRGLVPALVLPPLLLAPFLGVGLDVFRGLALFARQWQFNSSIFWALWMLTGKSKAVLYQGEVAGWTLRFNVFHLLKLVTSTVFVAWLGWLVLRWPDREDRHVLERILLALAGLLLLSPITDPWYLPWLLPYACVLPSQSVSYLTSSIFCYYLYFLRFEDVWWHRAVEYLPFYALFAQEILAGRPLGTRLPESFSTPDP